MTGDAVRRRGVGLVVLLLAAAGCAPRPAGETLPELVHPPLDELDPQVASQIAGARDELERLLASGAAPPKEVAGAYGRLGMLYQVYDLTDPALAAYLHALHRQPDSFRWRYLLARVQRVRGELEAAATSLRGALALDGADVPALVALGEVELERNRLAEAERSFRAALDVDGLCARALLGLGRCAAADGRPAEAVRLLERARGLAPEAGEIHYPLAVAYRETGEIARAEALLAGRSDRRVPLADPLLAELESLARGKWAHLTRARALHRSGKLAQAIEEYRRAIEADPGDAHAHTHHGLALAGLGRRAEAERALREGVRLAPRDPHPRLQLALHLAGGGDDRRAEAVLREVVALDPGQPRAWFELGNALRRLGRFDEAAAAYAAAVERSPAHGPSRLGEALALLRLHDWAGARARLERAWTVLPGDTEVLHALVRLLAAAPVGAVRDGPRALELSAGLTSGEIRLDHLPALAMVAAENGMFDEAIRVQQRAIEAHRRAGRSESLPRLERDLAGYRRGEPCRRPWDDDDPRLTPPPLTARASVEQRVEDAEHVE